jgi:hypothetical protein
VWRDAVGIRFASGPVGLATVSFGLQPMLRGVSRVAAVGRPLVRQAGKLVTPCRTPVRRNSSRTTFLSLLRGTPGRLGI